MSWPDGPDCDRIILHEHRLSTLDPRIIPPAKFLSPNFSTDAILRFGVQESTVHSFHRDFGRSFHDQDIWMATSLH
jgi:hypothetical protein